MEQNKELLTTMVICLWYNGLMHLCIKKKNHGNERGVKCIDIYEWAETYFEFQEVVECSPRTDTMLLYFYVVFHSKFLFYVDFHSYDEILLDYFVSAFVNVQDPFMSQWFD